MVPFELRMAIKDAEEKRVARGEKLLLTEIDLRGEAEKTARRERQRQRQPRTRKRFRMPEPIPG